MIDRRTFIAQTGALGAAVVGSVALTGCSGGAAGSAASASSASIPSGASAGSASASSSAESMTAPIAKPLGNSIIVFFSRAGENYEVGVVDEGNTAKLAHWIAGKVVSDVFELVPATEYPFGYDDCRAQARSEAEAKARPAVVDMMSNFDEYDTIYLGYPLWWGDLPMCVYTFVESKNWAGKKLVPFCTYGDDGIGQSVESLKRACSGATVTEGLAIRGAVAQNDLSSADSEINAWLAKVRA